MFITHKQMCSCVSFKTIKKTHENDMAFWLFAYILYGSEMFLLVIKP